MPRGTDRNRTGGKDGELFWLMPGGARNATVRLGAAPQPTDQRMKPVYGTSLATARYTGYLAVLVVPTQRTREGHGHIESEPARRIRTPTLAYQHTQPPPDGADATTWGRGTLRTPPLPADQTRPGEHVTVNGGVSPLESVIVARRDPGPLAGLERQVSFDRRAEDAPASWPAPVSSVTWYTNGALAAVASEPVTIPICG